MYVQNQQPVDNEKKECQATAGFKRKRRHGHYKHDLDTYAQNTLSKIEQLRQQIAQTDDDET